MTLGRRRSFFACFIALAAACLKTNTLAAQVCLLLPQSGPQAKIGKMLEKVLEEVLVAHSIPTFVIDSAQDRPEAVFAGVKEKGCLLAIGGIGDKEAQGLARAAEDLGFPLIALGRANPEGVFKHVVWAVTPRAYIIDVLANAALEMGRKYAYILTSRTNYGREVARLFKEAFEQHGGEVKFEGEVDEDLGHIAKVVSEKRKEEFWGQEVLFVGLDLLKARRLLGFLQFEGVNTKGENSVVLLGTAIWNDLVRLSRIGNALDGAFFADVETQEGMNALEREAREAGVLAAVALNLLAGEGNAVGREKGIAALLDGVRFAKNLFVRSGRVVGRQIVVYEIRSGTLVERWRVPTSKTP